jgi:hypothetical protein
MEESADQRRTKELLLLRTNPSVVRSQVPHKGYSGLKPDRPVLRKEEENKTQKK